MLSGAEIETIPAKSGTKKERKINRILSDFIYTEYALQHDYTHADVINNYYWWLRGVTEDRIDLTSHKIFEMAQCASRGVASSMAEVVGYFGVHPAIWVDIDEMKGDLIPAS